MSTRILIAGGGIGGLTLSIQLAKSGLLATVAERSAQLGGQGYSLLLWPNALRLLGEIDAELAGKIRAAGSQVDGNVISRRPRPPSGKVLL